MNFLRISRDIPDVGADIIFRIGGFPITNSTLMIFLVVLLIAVLGFFGYFGIEPAGTGVIGKWVLDKKRTRPFAPQKALTYTTP